MKGIVLAGGTGSRLSPLTLAFSKQLLPIYNKPLIFYPISTLMAAGIREIAIIATPKDIPLFKSMIGDGSRLGMSITYLPQNKPNGIAEAFIIAEDFISKQSTALILGDNLFYGVGLGRHLQEYQDLIGARIFGYQVKDPTQYGIVEIGDRGEIKSIEEKPIQPKSRIAVTGLYFYDQQVSELAKTLTPSSRGELEITDLNNLYLQNSNIEVSILTRGVAWLDTGDFQNLHNAATFVRTLEERQGMQIACLEEISWRNNWISDRMCVFVFDCCRSSFVIHLFESQEEAE
jgi:glucose-1-phosphate thymidylyltransferase